MTREMLEHVRHVVLDHLHDRFDRRHKIRRRFAPSRRKQVMRLQNSMMRKDIAVLRYLERLGY